MRNWNPRRDPLREQV